MGTCDGADGGGTGTCDAADAAASAGVGVGAAIDRIVGAKIVVGVAESAAWSTIIGLAQAVARSTCASPIMATQ
ncbi:MAG: hypothetical protein ACI9BK_001153 [Acidimicrobiales bacterium]|jgi:hypothetical protein